MLHFPERLRMARQMSGFTLDALAQRLEHRITKQALHKYELGTATPSSEMILALCKALGVPTDFFTRTRQVRLEHYSFRKLLRLPKREQTMALAKTQDALERYLELEAIIGADHSFDRRVMEALPLVRTPEDAESAAEVVRQEYSLGTDPLFNLVELLEDRGIKMVEVWADDAFSGMSSFVDKEIPVIVLNSLLDEKLDRKRFTALHELAHLLLKIEAESEKAEEKLCDRFAGAMLLPRNKIMEILGAHRSALMWDELVLIKELYGISIRAILYRAKENGIISEFEFTLKMAELNRIYGRKNEPGTYRGVEKATRFRQLLLRGLAEEVISLSKAAMLAGKKLAEFRQALEQPHENPGDRC